LSTERAGALRSSLASDSGTLGRSSLLEMSIAATDLIGIYVKLGGEVEDSKQ
jgi:hypothetical protein